MSSDPRPKLGQKTPALISKVNRSMALLNPIDKDAADV